MSDFTFFYFNLLFFNRFLDFRLALVIGRGSFESECVWKCVGGRSYETSPAQSAHHAAALRHSVPVRTILFTYRVLTMIVIMVIMFK